ncbi:hypothetical protein IM774_09075 [Erysipelotrichaceae bacterium RD49]|nr:hypothetical protein [Erysipelotrichaceae bacterium RD49]
MANEIFDAYTNLVKVNINPTEAILTFYKETPDPDSPDHVSAEIIGRVRMNPQLLINLCTNIASGTKKIEPRNEFMEGKNEASKPE